MECDVLRPNGVCIWHVQHVSSLQLKDAEIVQLEKQLTENVREHQDLTFEKQKALSTLQAQLDKVTDRSQFWSCVMYLRSFVVGTVGLWIFRKFKFTMRLVAHRYMQRSERCILSKWVNRLFVYREIVSQTRHWNIPALGGMKSWVSILAVT